MSRGKESIRQAEAEAKGRGCHSLGCSTGDGAEARFQVTAEEELTRVGGCEQ